MNKTFTERYKQVTKDLKAIGVKKYRNVQGCCRSCVGVEKFDNPTEPIIWNYAGQGNRIELSGNYVYDTDGGDVETIYLYHSLITPELAEKVLEVYKANGIVIEWDGSSASAIKVKPQLSIAYRTDEEQAHLLNDLFNEYGYTFDEVFGYRYFRNSFELKRLWDLQMERETIEQLFINKRNQDERDAEERRKREERVRKQEQQDSFKEQLLAVAQGDNLERFTAWLDATKTELTAEDIADAGERLMALEDSLFIGKFDEKADLARMHYKEDVERLPKWVLDNLRLDTVADNLTYWQDARYTYKNMGWGKQDLAWKKEA